MILSREDVVGRRIVEVLRTEWKTFDDEQPAIDVCYGYVRLDNGIWFSLQHVNLTLGERFCAATDPLPALYPITWPETVQSPHGRQIVDVVTCHAPSVGVILDDDQVLLCSDGYGLFSIMPCFMPRTGSRDRIQFQSFDKQLRPGGTLSIRPRDFLDCVWLNLGEEDDSPVISISLR